VDADAIAGEQIVLTRDLAAPPEEVWRFWTEPELLRQWHAQANCDIPVCTTDLRVGGRHFMCVRGNAGTAQEWNTYCGWTFTAIEPERRFTAHGFFADQDGNEVPPSHYGATVWPEAVEIAVELDPRKGGTRLTYTETALPMPDHAQTVSQILDQLVELVNSAER
jgi:uncharacterized protein YndB with AHSA1/START domain